MRLVTFKAGGSGGTYVLINGVIKAYISSGPDRYISVTASPDGTWPNSTHMERHTIARFKRNHPMIRAREFCRIVFSALDIGTVIELVINQRMTPVDLKNKVEAGEIKEDEMITPNP